MVDKTKQERTVQQ